VPIRSLQDKTPIVIADAAAYVQAQLDAGGTVALMTTSRIPTEYDRTKVIRVDPVDTRKVIAERRSEFNRRFQRLKDSEAWSDPLALFEAARFAYANRNDEPVTDILDRALLLNPELAAAVKEDEAQPYFENMVSHLNKGNKGSAAGHLGTLKRNFEDTVIYQQARAYYDGNAKAALAAAEEAKRRIEEARQREFEERRKLAHEAKDQETVAKLEQEEEALKEQAQEPDLSKIDGDRAKAEALYQQGEKLYAEAIDAGNTSKRDDLYGEAEGWLRKAQAIYSKLVNKSPNDADLNSALVRCNQLVYGCRKQRRFL
jgi:hypothetical protein